jgi:uncharacterized protein (TIGR03083 family)
MATDDDVAADQGPIAVLGASVERLHRLASGLTADQIRLPAYPSEWTVAQVLSHIGSGAVIMRRRLEDTLAGHDFDDAFMQATWDTWNAKAPDDQAADALVADRALFDALAGVGPDQRDGFRMTFGPLDLDFAAFVALRLNEHGLHTWDIAVVLDPSAGLPADVTGKVVDALERMAGWTGRPAASPHTLRIRTTDPHRDFTLELGTEHVVLTPSPPAAGTAAAGGADTPVDLELPAESFIRLIYGRLDPDHTPPTVDEAHLDELRHTFPGP